MNDINENTEILNDDAKPERVTDSAKTADNTVQQSGEDSNNTPPAGQAPAYTNSTQYGQNQYYGYTPPYNPYNPPHIVNKNSGLGNGMAVASLVCGIVGVMSFWFCCFGAIPAVLAIVFGIISLVNHTEYKPMAVIGIVLGGIGLVLTLFVTVFWGLIINFSEPTNDYSYSYSYQYPFNDYM